MRAWSTLNDVDEEDVVSGDEERGQPLLGRTATMRATGG